MTQPRDDASHEGLSDADRFVIDSRAEHDKSVRNTEELRDAVDTWRTRAEERAARITQLELERTKLRTVSGWLRSRFGAARPLDTSAPENGHSPVPQITPFRPQIPGVSVASNAGGAVLSVFRESDVRGLASRSWNSADVVVVDPSVLSGDERSSLLNWLSLTSRPPTVVVDSDVAPWVDADLILGTAVGSRNHYRLPSPIDATQASFVGSRDDRWTGLRLPSDLDLVRSQHGLIEGVVGSLDEWTSDVITQIAARGLPVGVTIESARAEGSGQLARRWAWTHRDPAILLSALLKRLGVKHRTPLRRVAGILVSNRPTEVGTAIDLFAGQAYTEKELVVGCHGFESNDVVRHLETRHPNLRAEVLELPGHMSLGACLNAAIESTTAPVLAKIDDDDYYGPSYLVDALHALRYSGASVVGKAAQFTYVQSVDRTVLRRRATEGTFLQGTMTGATLVFRRSAWEDVGFPDRPRKVDVYFLDGARAVGHPVYANERWEFVYRRNLSGHTWQVDDSLLIAESQPAWDGWNPKLADL